MTILIQDVERIKADAVTKEKIKKVLYHAGELAVELLVNGTGMHYDIRIKLGRGVREAGHAQYFRKEDRWELVLSRAFIEDCDFEFMDDTIRHELAHIYAGIEAGHGHVWKSVARRFGANPNRCHDKVLTTRLKYVAQCGTCDEKYYRARKPKGVHACSRCCNGVFNKKYVISFVNNPEYAA